MADFPVIELRPNGPLLVRGLDDLRDAVGNRLETDDVIALCRCGHSGNKPYCDGTHKKIGFSDEKISDGAGKRGDYTGKKIVIHDNRSICAHAGYCTDGLAAVFRYGKQPWIDPDGADVEAIAETVRKCPSGALSYSLQDAGQDQPGEAPSITVTGNGPYAVKGPVALAGVAFGEGASKTRYTLCRCGGSRNKPFCDGTHHSTGFTDEQN